MIIRLIYFLVLCLSTITPKGLPAQILPGFNTVEELWQQHPDQLRSLFLSLNLYAPDLSEVQLTIQSGDTVLASKLLLNYYEKAERNWVVGILEYSPVGESLVTANLLTHDSVNIASAKDQVPRTVSGNWQWDFTGPHHDDEFGYSLNGHKYLPDLYHAWQHSDSLIYVKVFDALIKDWVVQHPLPAVGDSIYQVLKGDNGLDYRDLGEVEWRTLEAGNRLGVSWPQLFYGFQPTQAFSPAARLLMLSSIAVQANYLYQYHKKGHNWTTMEMNGLALAGLAFPEFKAAERWAAYALKTMEQEINRQVYPDGVQTELSTKTQWVALSRFESIATNFQKAGREISKAYMNRVEQMYNYLAYSLRPDGHQPLNNDSDREDLRPRVLKAANKFDRPDWQWIATNGKTGHLPDSLPSLVFPWAGINIMRNGWDAEAHWSFFDNGPFGTGHQHADKLHLSIAAYGKDLLVDGGRYTHMNYFSFDPTKWRGYFRSSFSHNVILVDDMGQNGGPTMVDQPLKEGDHYVHHPEYDFARGYFTDGFEELDGNTDHSRSVLYLHDQYWVVVDHFETDRPRDLKVLWHYAPSCEVVLEKSEAVSVNVEEANLRIVPIGEIPWHAEVLSGQEKPFIQGWYSADYGNKEPTATVVYTTTIDKPTTFAWLLVPAKGAVPKFTAKFTQKDLDLEVSVAEQGQNPVTINFPEKGEPTVK